MKLLINISSLDTVPHMFDEVKFLNACNPIIDVKRVAFHLPIWVDIDVQWVFHSMRCHEVENVNEFSKKYTTLVNCVDFQPEEPTVST